MAGRIIGRVAVKVIPETSGFRSRAAADLKKIEKQLGDVKVDLNLRLSGKEKQEIKEIKDL